MRYYRQDAETRARNTNSRTTNPALAEIAGVLLNAVFMDSLEVDIERLDRINHTVSLVPTARRSKIPSHLRPIPYLALRPSVDLGTIVADLFRVFPLTVRHLLRGLGATNQRGWDFLSYLAFDGAYTRPLLELGYHDTMAQHAQVEALLSG